MLRYIDKINVCFIIELPMTKKIYIFISIGNNFPTNMPLHIPAQTSVMFTGLFLCISAIVIAVIHIMYFHLVFKYGSTHLNLTQNTIPVILGQAKTTFKKLQNLLIFHNYILINQYCIFLTALRKL